jgi:hypothetical protein
MSFNFTVGRESPMFISVFEILLVAAIPAPQR